MDLLDALSGNTTAASPVELCEHPLFRRGYSALYKAIVQFCKPSKLESAWEEKKLFQQSLLKALAPLIPAPTERKFHLFGLDTTPRPRPFAKTLEDRAYIHQPNTIKGNKPINIGHLYSLFSFLPERHQTPHIPWSIPLSGQRVPADSNPVAVGLEQDEIVETSFTTRRGRSLHLTITCWHQMLMRGTKEYPMHLTLLAYVQLWSARELVDNLPRSWEKYYHSKNHNSITPSRVQRDFSQIIRQIGTPAVSPKPRGFSTGRIPGNLREKRKRHPVIKKGKKIKSSTQTVA